VKASDARIRELEALLDGAAGALPDVSGKKMFGCHALFAKGNVFALVWKVGQIGVKLTNDKDYERLMALPGAAPWKAGPMKMAHWVLVPPSLESESRVFNRWVARAHELALFAPPKAAKKKMPTKKKK
jgi:TfoX/Sxy family transcriptional regulator of competence genes